MSSVRIGFTAAGGQMEFHCEYAGRTSRVSLTYEAAEMLAAQLEECMRRVRRWREMPTLQEVIEGLG